MYKETKWFFQLEYILLFLVGFEFLYKHHYMIFALFLLLVIKNKVKNDALNRDFFWVFIWGLIYFIFGTRTYSVLHIPALICAFIIGYSMLREQQDIFRMLLIIGVGYGVEGLLTLYFGGGMTLIAEDEMGRSVQSIWGETVGLTAQNAILYIFSGILVCIITRKNISWSWKLIAVVFELGAVYDALRTASRSPLVYCPIIIIVSLLAYNGGRLRFRSSMSLFMVIISLFVLYKVNAFGIKSTYENSFLFTRITEQANGGAANNGRFDLQSRFPDVWTLDMMGGLHDKIGYYFHNTWLDMYAFSGVFGFIAFMFLTIRVVIDFIYVYRRTEPEERSIWAGVFTAFMLPMYFEPQYWGAPAYFAFFFIFYGMLSKRCDVLNKERQSVNCLLD